MKKTIKTFLLALLCIGISSYHLILPTFAEPSQTNQNQNQPCSDVCECEGVPPSVKEAAGCSDYDQSNDKLPNTVISIINIVIGISGLIAVIFIVIGGIQYMTSTGDPGKTKKARDTILYAAIGLIICALAFAIVNFVIYDVIAPSTTPDDAY